MARVSQFAKDLGISYNQAKDLINKGRKRRDGGSQILEKTMSKTEKDPMAERFGKDGEYKVRPKSTKPYHPTLNPDQYHPILNPDGKKGRPKVEKKKDGGLGMQSVKYGLDNNPAITAADPKAKFIAANKKKDGGMPMMPKETRKTMGFRARSTEPKKRRSEPPVTLSPFKGVLKTSEGERLTNIDGTTYLVKPNPKFKRAEREKAPRRMRDGGVFRGCGAQVKGKKFKGIF